MKTVLVTYDDLYLNIKDRPVLVSDQLIAYKFSDRLPVTYAKNAAVSRLCKMKASYGHFVKIIHVSIDPDQVG